jgi:hypothetical protein
VVEQEIAVSNNQLKSTFGGGNKAPIVSFSFGNISEVENTGN